MRNRQSHSVVSLLDEAHRIVIDVLDRTGRFEDSILIFTSDNGGVPIIHSDFGHCAPGSNYPLRGGKYSFFEGGIRLTSLIHSRALIPKVKHGTADTGLMSLNDWKVALLSASGHRLNLTEREFDFDHWPRLSSPNITSNRTQSRSELSLQSWKEVKNYVVLFVNPSDNKLYKIIKGPPLKGSGTGYVGRFNSKYTLSEIEQPPELPSSEATYYFTTKIPLVGYRCSPPGCLFNVEDDPQERYNLALKSRYYAATLRYAQMLVNQYSARGLEPRFTSSGHCDWGFYPSPKLFSTDVRSVLYAQSCKAWLLWLYANSTYKPFTDCPEII